MKKYKAQIELVGELTEVEFETADNPVEYLWQQYGISTYIARVEEVEE